jgi:type I restriction enzyme S subunit
MTKAIPTNWKEVKLDEITSKISDGLHSTPKYVDNSNYYFINGNNLINNKIVINKNTKCVDKNEYEKHKKDIDNTTILLSINGTIGNVSYYKGEKVVLGKSTAYLNCSSACKKEFVFYLLKTSKIKNYFKGEVTGSTIKNLSIKSIKNTKVLLPPLTEQKRIVGILETWDKALNELNLKIKLKKNIQKGLMQKLLTGKIRLPEFNEEWENYTINELFKVLKGWGLSKEKLNKSGEYKCILYGEIYTKYSEVIKNIQSSTKIDEGIKSQKGDILIPASTTTNALDLAKATTLIEDNILIGGDINILRKKNTSIIDSIFLSYYLNHAKKHELARLAQGITIVHLYGKDFKNLVIKIPKLKEEQTAIAQILITADDEITALERKYHILEQQKKYLLNNLITGKIRTPENLTLPTK